MASKAENLNHEKEALNTSKEVSYHSQWYYSTAGSQPIRRERQDMAQRDRESKQRLRLTERQLNKAWPLELRAKYPGEV